MRARVKVISLVLLITLSIIISFYLFKNKPEKKKSVISEVKTTSSKFEDQFYEELGSFKSSKLSKLQILEQKVNAKQAFDTRDWYSARSNFIRIIANNPDDFQAWVFLSKTLQELVNSNPDYQKYKDEYNLVLDKARTVANAELDKKVIEQFDAQEKDAEVKIQLEALLSTYPKEFAPYFLDIPQQADLGTACISWTYPLLQNRDFNYENYLTISPQVKDIGIIARGNKLCVEGLRFGENYEFIFKKGFKGKSDISLEEEQSLGVFIPNRKSQIRFKERGYLLPSFGPQVVPFIAVNVPKVLIKIVHIPERNIHSLRDQWFSNQIGSWQLYDLIDEQGELVWEGNYFCESELNKTGISGLPIEKMLGKNLKPGVYVIEAKITENSYDAETTTQALIVSDIGLSSYMGPDGLHVMARNLGTAKIIPDVQVNLIARNNSVLASQKTNQFGIVNFAESIINGDGGNSPAFLSASVNGKQFTVLNLRNEAFDFSYRGSKGRSVTSDVQAYLFSERGIYRPGELVHLQALARQSNGNALMQAPLTLKLFRPDGVLAQTSILKDEGNGAYFLDFIVNSAAPTGMWTASLYLDLESSEIGSTSFEVHDFIPPRIEVKTSSPVQSIKPYETHNINVSAQYYFGAPAQGLKVGAESILTKSTQPFNQWQAYHFGLEEEVWNPLRFAHGKTVTDDKGHAVIQAKVDVTPKTTQLLQLETTVNVFEANGRPQPSKIITQLWHQPYAIGIKPQFDGSAPNNAEAAFELIALNQQGQLQASEPLSYTLFEEQHDYVWFRSGTQWQYEMITRDKVANTGKVSLTQSKPTLLKVPVQSGLYRLEVLDIKTGIASSLRFSAGWYSTNGAPDKPDMLDIRYEKGKLIVNSPFDGELLVAMAGQAFKPIYTGKVKKDANIIDLSMLNEQLPIGAYLIGTVFRPADVNSALMPARAIGLTWVNNDKLLKQHKIEFGLDVPSRVKSNSQVNVNVKVPANHNQMRVSVALVDEATLSLVNFESPNPFDYFFSQKKLDYALRDSYGVLINPFGARPGSFEEGGDGEMMAAKSFSAQALSQLPVKAYKVVSLLKKNISANGKEIISIPFDIPEFTGKLRVMAVAWDDKAVGEAQSSVIVRDTIDAYFSLPRFLAPLDSANVPLVLKNLEGAEGNYQIKFEINNKLIEQTIFLKRNKETKVYIPLKFETLGVKNLKLQITGPDNYQLNRHWEISVRPKTQSLAIQQFGVLQPQKSMQLDSSTLKNLNPDTSTLYLTIGSLPDYGKAQLVKDLMNYPYACLEQTTSKMLATALADSIDKEIISKGFNQLASLQKIDGSFGLWSTIGQQEPWLTFYAADVLNILQKKGFDVPQALTLNLQKWIKEMQQKDDVSIVAYASYLQAKLGKGDLGTLRYFVETHEDIKARKDLAFIGAAFALYGEQNQAKVWLDKAIQAKSEKENEDFGSDVRDLAILVSLMGETTQNHPKLFELANELSSKANEVNYLSTQEKAWLIRAATQLQEIQQSHQINLNNEVIKGKQSLQKRFTQSDLKQPVKITNTLSSPLFYSLSKVGEPIKVDELKQQGFTIERDIYSMEGKKVDINQLKSGERYLVVIQGERLNSEINHVLLVDLLPAGFEIEEANLLKNNTASVFPWLETLTPASRMEGRDDRFYSAYEFNSNNKFTAAYSVRAVSPGTFTYPAVYIEAMYQPQNFKYGQAQTIKID